MFKKHNHNTIMELPIGPRDHTDNEFYKYRYSTRFEKGEIVEIRTGLDLEVARFQARKSFPDVLNEYWWLKPSDVPTLRNLPLRISDIYYYHGGVPVFVLFTANGTLSRKAQVFLKKKDEQKNVIPDDLKEQIDKLDENNLSHLITDPDLLVRYYVVKKLNENYPDFIPADPIFKIKLSILNGNYDNIANFGELAVEHLIERFFVTSHAKETEKIIDTLIEIGEPALEKLDDIKEFLSFMASPYYAKRINWTVNQIIKRKQKFGTA